MTDSGLQNIIDRINSMAIQGPYCNTFSEMEAWMKGYSEATQDIITMLRSMMDGR